MGTIKALVLVCLLLFFIFSDVNLLLHTLIALLDACAVMGVIAVIAHFVGKDE